MKEIYSFSVDLETKTTQEVEKVITDKETGKKEKVKVEEEITSTEPIANPLRKKSIDFIIDFDFFLFKII